MNKEYALVLAGGGAKGVYQIGVLKALKEFNVKINAVIGNSVGALNGAMIVQGNYKDALDLWQNMGINKILKIPENLIRDGCLYIDGENIKHLTELRKNYFKNFGLDTSPLKDLIKKYVNEKTIRNKKTDFGIVTYQLNDFKPIEIFINEIEEGLLHKYLLASASIPFVFKATEIKGKHFIDGGVHDNIPFTMAKNRGYKNIIVVDISGLGITRKFSIAGTNVIYIKNSIDMGNILDFSKKFINDYMNLGYLDTLKIFEKVKGIKYFFNIESKIKNKLENILYDTSIIKEYSKYLKLKGKKLETIDINQAIKEILPQEFKNYKDIIIPLAESAALSLNIKRDRMYSFKEFIEAIWDRYCQVEKEIIKIQEKRNRNFFEVIAEEIKKKDIKSDFRDFFKKSTFEIDNTLEIIFDLKKSELYNIAVSNFFPSLLSAKVFFIILKYYFSLNK